LNLPIILKLAEIRFEEFARVGKEYLKFRLPKPGNSPKLTTEEVTESDFQYRQIGEVALGDLSV
jgi:hypothetical protein